MTKKFWVVALTALGLTVPSKVWTQETQPDTAVVRVVTEELISHLHNYLVAQDSFYANNNTYARFSTAVGLSAQPRCDRGNADRHLNRP